MTGWGTATRWTICWRSSPARKSIRPARKPLYRPRHPRSICWWTSRQNSRPEKAPVMLAGQGVQPKQMARPSTTCLNTGCWIMPIRNQNSRGDGPLPCAVRSDQGRREAHGRDRRAANSYRQLRQDPRHLCGLPQGRVFKEIPAGA